MVGRACIYDPGVLLRVDSHLTDSWLIPAVWEVSYVLDQIVREAFATGWFSGGSFFW